MRVLRGFLRIHPLKLGFAFAAGSIGVWEPGCGKGLVRSLGRGNEQDARFTILQDSETPRSESKQLEQVGDHAKQLFPRGR